MSPKQYPQLTAAETRKILKARGFEFKRQKGSHEAWEGIVGGVRRVVTVDENDSPFDAWSVERHLQQSGLSREEWYGSTKKTARRAGVEWEFKPPDDDDPGTPEAQPA